MPKLVTRLTTLSLIASLSTFSLAGPTGLIAMPIADILKHREAVAELSLAGTERNVSKHEEKGNSLTVGLFDRVEIGYDNDFEGGWEGNAKLQLFEDLKRLPHFALSVGATGIHSHSLDSYVVGRYDGQGYRLHCGCWHTGGVDRLMVGTDFPSGPSLVGSVEYLSGPGSTTWASLTYAIPHLAGFEVTAAVGIPSAHADGIQHELSLAYGFKF